MKKRKVASPKEKKRREEQSLGNAPLYLDGKGGTFRMHKNSKNSYRIY